MCGTGGENDGPDAPSVENDIEAAAFGISTGIGNPEAEPEDFDDTTDFGRGPEPEVDFSMDPGFGLFDPAFDPEEEEDEGFFSQLDRSLKEELGKGRPPRGTLAGTMFDLAEGIGQGLHDLGVELGLDPQAEPQGPSTGFGETGAEDDRGDGADTTRQPPLARSVRPPRRNDVSGPGASPSPAPPPPLDLPSSDIDEIRRDLEAERDARRRRRRASRQSTIVTGPLGVMGRPELLRPTAIAGASRRLLGQ